MDQAQLPRGGRRLGPGREPGSSPLDSPLRAGAPHPAARGDGSHRPGTDATTAAAGPLQHLSCPAGVTGLQHPRGASGAVSGCPLPTQGGGDGWGQPVRAASRGGAGGPSPQGWDRGSDLPVTPRSSGRVAQRPPTLPWGGPRALTTSSWPQAAAAGAAPAVAALQSQFAGDQCQVPGPVHPRCWDWGLLGGLVSCAGCPWDAVSMPWW